MEGTQADGFVRRGGHLYVGESPLPAGPRCIAPAAPEPGNGRHSARLASQRPLHNGETAGRLLPWIYAQKSVPLRSKTFLSKVTPVVVPLMPHAFSTIQFLRTETSLEGTVVNARPAPLARIVFSETETPVEPWISTLSSALLARTLFSTCTALDENTRIPSLEANPTSPFPTTARPFIMTSFEFVIEMPVRNCVTVPPRIVTWAQPLTMTPRKGRAPPEPASV